MKQKHKNILPVLALLLGLIQPVCANLPGYLTGQMTIGDPTSLINGDLVIASTGELYLGPHSPRGLQTNMLSITGNYVGEAGSQIFVSVTNNDNTQNTRGYIDIVGTATKTDGATQIMLDMFDSNNGWDGSCITLIRANKSGSDVGTFRMDDAPQVNERIAVLRYREQGNDIVWYLSEKLIRGQKTAEQSVCLGKTFDPLTVDAISNCTFQWYRCDANGANLVYIDGANTAHYTPPATEAGTKYYRCVVSSRACKSVEDSYNTDTTFVSGAITVGAPIRIVNRPLRQVVPKDGTVTYVTLGVTAEGLGLTYQWYKNGVIMTGETSEDLHVSDFPDGTTADEYFVKIMNACGDTLSSDRVTVGSCLELIVQKRNHTLVVNNNPKAVANGGNGGYNFVYYTWYKNAHEFLKEEEGGLVPGDFKRGGYYYTGGNNLRPQDGYYAVLIDKDGNRYQTCEFHPVININSNVTAYPIPLTSSANYVVTVDAELSDEAVLADATIDLYNAAGAFLGRTNATGRFTQVTLPSISGVYVLSFKSSEINKEIKVIVE